MAADPLGHDQEDQGDQVHGEMYLAKTRPVFGGSGSGATGWPQKEFFYFRSTLSRATCHLFRIAHVSHYNLAA